MNWTFLRLAILFETVGTTAMLALKQLDVSLAYAIWSGVGTALITIIGIWWFNESVSIMKMISIVLIILGVIGLHISSAGDEVQSKTSQRQNSLTMINSDTNK
ncbi:multidrug efflux SMR transporter [Paenibacillus sp. yr247]|uniref:DMT family transporter n=1 Tax=Paenibacillus sp. yr247 TaxID=1761880 RepID=UPI000B82E50C|nr:multidrug efflux SMR transporter [Paenibacillus sp. yr247]